MSQAHDALTLSNSTSTTSAVTGLKHFLRLISNDDVLLTFSDGSKLYYKRHKSWRFDTLQVVQET